MVNWTAIFFLSLICHGGYSKPQYQNEGEPEKRSRELDNQDKEEPMYDPTNLEFLGK